MKGELGGAARMKLLFLSQIDVSRPFTGSARRIQETLAQLSRNHEVHLVHVLTPPGAPGSEVPQRLPGGLASATAVARGGLGSKFFNPRLWRAAERLHRDRRFDLVITEFGEAGAYGLAFRFLRGVPFVYMMENVESRLHLERAPPNLRRRAFAFFLGVVERLSARYAALVTTCSEADAATARVWVRSGKIRVLAGGFNASVFNPEGARAASPPRIVFLGGLTYEPNREAAEFIIDQVMEPVLQAVPDARFQFIGVHEPGFEKTAPKAEFTGYVEDLAACLKQARLVLAPIFSGGGMRMKTMEALACGKVVVAAGLGAEGIELSGVTRVRLVEREAFADAVIDELRRGTADDGVDFPFLRARHSSQAAIERFERDLGEVLAARRSRGRAGREASRPGNIAEESLQG